LTRRHIHKYVEDQNHETSFKDKALQAAVDSWCKIQVTTQGKRGNRPCPEKPLALSSPDSLHDAMHLDSLSVMVST
jgi:hypothetical protein